MKVAAIDIGSNSIHMVVARIDAHGHFTLLDRAKEMVRLGKGSLAARALSRDAMQAGMQTLATFKRLADTQQADRVVIANTKGFTGHAMGAGIEDVVAVKALETGVVPPVANFKEVDPELGELNLSKGGIYPIEYALRLGAGFGVWRADFPEPAAGAAPRQRGRVWHRCRRLARTTRRRKCQRP